MRAEGGRTHRSTRTTTVTLGLIAVSSGLALAGCGGSRPAAVPVSTNQQTLRALLGYSRCLRAHGIPNFPDPVTRKDGVPEYPESAPRVPSQDQQACRAAIASLPASYTPNPTLSPHEVRQMLQVSNCMRRHGIFGWPDPNSQGQFPINPSDASFQQDKPRIGAAMAACQGLSPTGEISIVQAHR